MASVVGRFCKARQILSNNSIHRGHAIKRHFTVYTETGSIQEKPYHVRFGLVKVAAIVFPFLYAGATLSKNGAAFLEENDIFVPDDDDD